MVFVKAKVVIALLAQNEKRFQINIDLNDLSSCISEWGTWISNMNVKGKVIRSISS